MILKDNFKFQNKNRLLSPNQYRFVFSNNPDKVFGKYLIILAKKNLLDYARLGLAISKKHVKKAVKRNQIKRVIRESFRHNLNVLKGLDVVVLSKNHIDSLAKDELRKSLDALWVKLQS